MRWFYFEGLNLIGMKSTFYQEIKTFQSIVGVLQSNGLKQKELAQHIGLHASALSSLVKGVFPAILKVDPKAKDLPKKIEQAFDAYNNVSERRVRQSIQGYNQRLQQLETEMNTPGFQSQRPFMDDLVAQSSVEILEKLQGIYACYYVSSFGYQVKCEPFMIFRKKGDRHFTVRKGNSKGPAAYTGIVYISNTHILTMQMQERGTIAQDHFFMHCILPPAYQGSMDLLRGLSVSISNAYFPIARRLILRRLHAHTDRLIYEEMDTQFFDPTETDHPIIEYLRSGISFMEYIPIPHPTFDEGDLLKEIAVREVLEKQGGPGVKSQKK